MSLQDYSHLAYYAALAAAGAGLITHLLIPAVSRVAVVLQAVDVPGGRRKHLSPVPRLGGVAIACGLVAGVLAAASAGWASWGLGVGRSDVAALISGSVLIFLVGLVDDLVGMSAWKKLLFQLTAASILIVAHWHISIVHLPSVGDVEIGALGAVLTVIWIVAVTNAINFIDGLDGLAGGVVSIIAASLLIFALIQASWLTVIVLSATVGACLGFLRHNWKGKIFMGDAGSLTLGYLLAALSVRSALKSSTAVAILVPILALGIPVIDSALVIALRFLGRPKTPLALRLLHVLKADRNHIHHLLESWTGSSRVVVRWIYALVSGFSVLAVTVAVTNSAAIGLTVVAVELLAVVIVRRLGLAARLREVAAVERLRIRRELAEPQPMPGQESDLLALHTQPERYLASK